MKHSHPFMQWRVLLAVIICATTLLPAKTSRADSLPEAAYIDGIVGHMQQFGLSCESRSAVDWAAYWGVEISEEEFLNNLPRSNNPNRGFVGDHNGAWGYIPPHSYGVHADPVADLLQDYGLEADARIGLSWDDLRAEIAEGRPVIVWIIGSMWRGTPRQYTAEDGDTVTVANFEHTMLLTGYDQRSVQVIDAYTGWTLVFHLDTFLASWSVLENMAVIGGGVAEPEPPVPAPLPWQRPQGGFAAHLPVIAVHAPAVNVQAPEPEEEEEESLPESYVVQRGDYLIKLAEGFGLDWRELAELNHITYPFVIYPGQELKLP